MPEESCAPGSILSENQVKSDPEPNQSWERQHQQPEMVTSTSSCKSGISQCESDNQAESEKEDPFRILVENSRDAIVVHNDGRILYANSAALLLVGADDLGQFASHTVLDYFPLEERDRSAERMRAAAELNRLPIREARLRRLDGDEVAVEFYTAAINFQGVRAIQTIIHDISERKRSEEEIRSLARFPSENPNPVLRVATGGRLLYANTASEPLLATWGCEVGAFLPDEWIRIVAETLEARTIHEREFIYRENRIISCILAPVPEAAYVNVYGRDVTEVRRAEKALRENEARFRLVLDRSPVVVAQVDRDLSYTWIHNPLGGHRPADILGKKIGILTSPESTARTRRVLDEVLTKGTKAQWETMLNSSLGNQTFQSYAEPLLDDHGSIIGASLVSVDITALKQAEEALRESESKYRSLFANLTEEVQFWRLVRNEKGLIETWKLVDANPPALKTWGRDLDAVVGKTADEILGPGYKEHYMPVVEKITAEGVPYVYEDYFPNLDKHFRFTSIPLGDYFITTGVDITGIKKAQIVLEARVKERTKELERRAAQLRALALELAGAEDRERRRLAQILHDDLQQILVAAKFATATVLMGTTEAKAQESLKRVKSLLNQSIDASRSLTSELSPPILYDAGLAEALRWLGRWMKEKHGLMVDLELDDSVDIPRDDRILLFRAARELLFNVSKHARVGRAAVQLRFPATDCVQIEVKDHGIGFDPALQNANDKMTGGFGLFSIRERLECLGGHLKIDSTLNLGTRVIVELPVALDLSQSKGIQARSKTRTVQAGDATSPIRVLLVDDHRIVREGLAQLLNGTPGIKVVGEAEDGYEAIDLARRLKPDVVVMDVSMPRMTGIEATRLIKADLPECCIIGLSMHDSAEMETSMREAGASVYLAKDGPSEVLINTIRGQPD